MVVDPVTGSDRPRSRIYNLFLLVKVQECTRTRYYCCYLTYWGMGLTGEPVSTASSLSGSSFFKGMGKIHDTHIPPSGMLSHGYSNQPEMRIQEIFTVPALWYSIIYHQVKYDRMRIRVAIKDILTHGNPPLPVTPDAILRGRSVRTVVSCPSS